MPEVLLPDVLLPVEPCCAIRMSQRVLVEPVAELGLEVLGLVLEPLPVVCETDTVAKLASAAAMAMPMLS